jgi:hypothetical protein
MDHKEAVHLQATERYVLGDLPTDLHEQYEEHYFDCPECARDLTALSTFVTASRELLEEESSSKFPAPESGSERHAKRIGWFGWLKPVIAVPAIVTLGATIIYQNAVMIPAARKRASTPSETLVLASSFRLQGATRGETTTKIAVRSDESFELNFDFTPSQLFQSYTGSLLDSADQTVLTFYLNREHSNKEMHLVIPGGKIHAGSYALVFVADNRSGGQGSRTVEVQRINFAVELRP